MLSKFTKYIAIIFLVGLLFILRDNFPDVKDNLTNANIIYFLVILVSCILGYSSKNALATFKSIIIWCLFFIFIVIGYSYKSQLTNVYFTVMSNIAPGKFIIAENHQLKISANANGHYIIYARINGTQVKFLVDTGASLVSIPLSIAKTAGINTENLVYNQPFSTANGTNFCAISTQNTISIENLELKNINISICPDGLSSSLLGMNFLQKLKKFSFNDDIMTITY